MRLQRTVLGDARDRSLFCSAMLGPFHARYGFPQVILPSGQLPRMQGAPASMKTNGAVASPAPACGAPSRGSPLRAVAAAQAEEMQQLAHVHRDNDLRLSRVRQQVARVLGGTPAASSFSYASMAAAIASSNTAFVSSFATTLSGFTVARPSVNFT